MYLLRMHPNNFDILLSILVANLMGLDAAPPAYMLTERNTFDKSGMTFAVGGAGVYEVPERLPTLAKQIHNFKRLIKDGSISKWHLADSVALIAISGNDYAHVRNSSNISNVSSTPIDKSAWTWRTSVCNICYL